MSLLFRLLVGCRGRCSILGRAESRGIYQVCAHAPHRPLAILKPTCPCGAGCRGSGRALPRFGAGRSDSRVYHLVASSSDISFVACAHKHHVATGHKCNAKRCCGRIVSCCSKVGCVSRKRGDSDQAVWSNMHLSAAPINRLKHSEMDSVSGNGQLSPFQVLQATCTSNQIEQVRRRQVFS